MFHLEFHQGPAPGPRCPLGPWALAGQVLGELLAQHPRLARLSLHGNALGEKGGAKIFQGLAENSRGAAGAGTGLGGSRVMGWINGGLGWRPEIFWMRF